MATKITILSENYTIGAMAIKAEHGISVLVEKDNSQILYDTGQTGICVDNAVILGKDLTKTEQILFSHGHMDHTGGIERVLQVLNGPAKIIAHPAVFEKKCVVRPGAEKQFIGIPLSKEFIETWPKKVSFDFQDGFYKAGDGIWLTGKVPFTNDIEKISDEFQIETESGGLQKDSFADDNTLIVDTTKGLIVILGCAHRGIVNILTYIKKRLTKNIHALIGGTHLNNADIRHFEFVKNYLKTIFANDKTVLFAPNHCTGLSVFNKLSVDFGLILKYASCGTVFEF